MVFIRVIYCNNKRKACFFDKECFTLKITDRIKFYDGSLAMNLKKVPFIVLYMTLLGIFTSQSMEPFPRTRN